MLQRLCCVVICAIAFYPLLGQKIDSTENNFLSRIFLPSIDVGFQIPNSSLIGPSSKFSTSIEYRVKNNNDAFIRLNYDTYGAQYALGTSNGLSNSISGTVQFSDIFIAPGYRFGDNTWRIMVSIMPGIKFYNFPTATLNGNEIEITQDGNRIFTSAALVTLEYYFDEKSAFTISGNHNQVWQNIDFWKDGRFAYGFSLGFITSLK